MKIALVSAFLEDDVYEKRLTDHFMENVICQEDHFYHRIAFSLIKKNHEVTVFYMSQEKELKEFKHKYGHKIVRVPAKKIPLIHESIIFSSKLLDLIKKFEICHFVSGYYVMYKIPDMFDYCVFKLNGKIPIVARWAGGNNKWLWPIRKKIKQLALRKCNKIICSGKDEIEVLQNIFEIPSEKISHLINPIDFNNFKKRDKTQVCKKLGFDPNKKYLLYVGRLIRNKGIEDLLSVFNKITNYDEELRLILIGDGPLLEFIQKFLKKNSLEGKVILKGRLSHDMICYYYNISSILFHIGTSGGLPNVIMESLASRLPIIASDNGANRDYVNTKLGTGKIIKSGDKSDLKNSISTILENEDMYGNTIPEKIMEFSYENFSKKMSKIFEEITK